MESEILKPPNAPLLSRQSDDRIFASIQSSSVWCIRRMPSRSCTVLQSRSYPDTS